MKKKALFSLLVALTLLVTCFAVPVYADTTPTFKLEGKVVLPGTDVAPDGGLFVIIEYRSDKGTDSLTDEYKTSSAIFLPKGAHEAPFNIDIPFTASADKSPKFTIGYSVPSTYQYWDRGYFGIGGMQYNKEGEMFFGEGSVYGLIITPLRASEISGTVGLPSYSATQSAIEVNVSAKTTGTTTSAIDDLEVKTKVSVSTTAAAFKLKVPATVTSAGYIVMYETNAADYEKQGYYSTTGTAITSSAAVKVDVSAGNRTDINLVLVKKVTPPVTPPPAPTTPSAISFDLNGDKKVDVKDQVLVAQAMGSAKKYNAAYDLNKDGVIDVKDLKIIKAEIDKAARANAQKKVGTGNGNNKK